MDTTPAIEQSLTQGKWLERRLWRAVAAHGGRAGHCQVACPLPLDVHSRIPLGVTPEAGTRRRQRLISKFFGACCRKQRCGASGGWGAQMRAGKGACTTRRLRVDGWGGFSVRGAGIGVLGRVLGLAEWARRRCCVGKDATPVRGRAGPAVLARAVLMTEQEAPLCRV